MYRYSIIVKENTASSATLPDILNADYDSYTLTIGGTPNAVVPTDTPNGLSVPFPALTGASNGVDYTLSAVKGAEDSVDLAAGKVYVTVAQSSGGGGGGTVTSADITDATDIGRQVLTAASAQEIRTDIGAGTSSLVIGTASNQAKAGNWLPSSADITDFNTAVNALIANVVDGAPAALDTLNELAAALGDDANFAATVTTQLATKASTTDLAAKVDKDSLTVNVKEHGAIGNGIADDTAAILSLLGPGKELFFPPGTYLVSGAAGATINDSGVKLRGLSRDNTSIVSTTGNVLTLSTTAMITGIGLQDISIFSNPGGGHCINTPYGFAQSTFSRVKIQQYNPGKSILYCHPTAAGGIFDNKWTDAYFYMPTTSTVPGFDVVGVGNPASANKWTRCRAQGGGTYMFHLEAGVQNYCYNNTFDTINFEQCDHGAIRIYSGMNTALNQIGLFDNSTIDTDLILFSRADNTKPQSNGIAIRSVHRSNGSLSAGAVDIKLASGQCNGSNVIEAVSCPSAAGLTMDLGASSGFAVLFGIDPNVTVLNFVPSRTVRLDTTSGLSAPLVAAAIRDNGGQVFNVMHPAFGAKGDGSTDDAAAISAAITIASATHGVVEFPPTPNGYASSAITLKSNVTLRSFGRTLLKRTGAGSAYFINIPAGVDNVRLTGFNIDSAGLSTSATVNVMGTNSKLVDCGFIASALLNPSVHAVQIMGGSNHSVIDDCDFIGLLDNLRVYADAKDVTVNGNRWDNWGNRAIFVVGSATLASSDVKITDNYIANVNTAATSTDSGWLGRAATPRQPIAIQGATGARHTGMSVSGNHVIGNGLAHHQGNDGGTLLGGTADCISLQHCENFSVTDNKVRDGGEAGITIAVDSRKGSLTGNVVSGCNTTPVALGGSAADVYDVTIEANTFSNNGKELSPPATGDRGGIHAAVWCVSAHGVLISGNTVVDDNTGTQRYVVYMLNSDGITTGTNKTRGLVSALDPASSGFTGYTSQALVSTSGSAADLTSGLLSIERAPVSTSVVVYSTTVWPARPTARTDVHVEWIDAGRLGTTPPGWISNDGLVVPQ